MKSTHVNEAVLDLTFYRDWVAKREQERKKDKTKRTLFVTISRDFGCEGYDVATALQKRINERSGSSWSLFTRKMLEEMAASPDIDASMVENVAKERWSFKDWFVDALVPSYLQSESTKVYSRMRTLILNLADKGNCVILGAGSQIVTHRLDPKKFLGLHFRVSASFTWRLNRISTLHGINKTEAESLLLSNQNARDRFISDFTGLNADDPSMYHLIFNNAKHTPDEMVELIIKHLEMHSAFE